MSSSSANRPKQDGVQPPLQKIIKKSSISKGLKDKILQFASTFEDINELLKMIINAQNIQGDQMKPILQEIEQKIKYLNNDRSRVQPKLAEISFGHLIHMIDIYQYSEDPNHRYLSFYLMKIWIKNIQYSEQYVQALLNSIEDSEPFQKEIFSFLQELSIEKPDVLDQILKIANNVLQNLQLIDWSSQPQDLSNQQQKTSSLSNKNKSQEDLLEFILNIIQKFESQSLEKDLLSLISKYTPQNNEAYHQIVLDNFLANEDNYEPYFNVCIEFIKKGLESNQNQIVIGYIKRTDSFYQKIKGTARRSDFIKALICPILILRQSKDQELMKSVRPLWKPTIFSDKEGQEKILEYLEDIISYLSVIFTGQDEVRILMAADSMIEIIDKVMKEQADVDRFGNEKKISILTNIQMGCFMNKMVKYDRVIQFYQKFVTKFNLTKNYQIQGFFRGDWKNLNALDINAVIDYFDKQQLDIKTEIPQKYHKFTAANFLLFLQNNQSITDDVLQKFQSITNAPPGLYKMNHNTIHGFLQTYSSLAESKTILESNLYHYFKLERIPQLKSLESLYGVDYIKNLIKEKQNDAINLQAYLSQNDISQSQKYTTNISSNDDNTKKIQREYSLVSIDQKRTLFTSANVPVLQPQQNQGMIAEEQNDNSMEIEQVKPTKQQQASTNQKQETAKNPKNSQNTNQAQKQQNQQPQQNQTQQKQQQSKNVDNQQKNSQQKVDQSQAIQNKQKEPQAQTKQSVDNDDKKNKISSGSDLENKNKGQQKQIQEVPSEQMEEEIPKEQNSPKNIEDNSQSQNTNNGNENQSKDIEAEDGEEEGEVIEKKVSLSSLPTLGLSSQKSNPITDKMKPLLKTPSEQNKSTSSEKENGELAEEKDGAEKMDIELEKKPSLNSLNKSVVQNKQEQPIKSNTNPKPLTLNLEIKKQENNTNKTQNQINTPTLNVAANQQQANKPSINQQKVQTPTSLNSQSNLEKKASQNNDGQQNNATNVPQLPVLNKPTAQLTMKEKAQLKMKAKQEGGANPQTPTATQNNPTLNLNSNQNVEPTTQPTKQIPSLSLKPAQLQEKNTEQSDKPQSENKPSLEALKKPSLPSLSMPKKKPEIQTPQIQNNQSQLAEKMDIENTKSDLNSTTPQNEVSAIKPALSLKPKIAQKTIETVQQPEQSQQTKQENQDENIDEQNKLTEEKEGEKAQTSPNVKKDNQQLGTQEQTGTADQASENTQIQSNIETNDNQNDNKESVEETQPTVLETNNNDSNIQGQIQDQSKDETENIQENTAEQNNKTEEQVNDQNDIASNINEEKQNQDNGGVEEEQNNNLSQIVDEQNENNTQLVEENIEKTANLENKLEEEEQEQQYTNNNQNKDVSVIENELNETNQIQVETEANQIENNIEEENQIEEEEQILPQELVQETQDGQDAQEDIQEIENQDGNQSQQELEGDIEEGEQNNKNEEVDKIENQDNEVDTQLQEEQTNQGAELEQENQIQDVQQDIQEGAEELQEEQVATEEVEQDQNNDAVENS